MLQSKTRTSKKSNLIQFQTDIPDNLVPKYGQTFIFPSIIFSLAILSAYILFLMTNITLVLTSQKVITKQYINNPPSPSVYGCHNYYCDQTGTYFLFALDFYQQCNIKNCANILCSNYDCSNMNQGNLNLYYMCAPKCHIQAFKNIPKIIYVINILGIVIVTIFIFGVFIIFLVSLYSTWNDKLSVGQKIALIMNPICPSIKYIVFKRRLNWYKLNISFRMLVYADIFMAFIIKIMLGGCLYYAITDVFIMYQTICSGLLGLVYFLYLNMLFRFRSQFTDFEDHLKTKNNQY